MGCTFGEAESKQRNGSDLRNVSELAPMHEFEEL